VFETFEDEELFDGDAAKAGPQRDPAEEALLNRLLLKCFLG
jgi:hypothetical protein